MLSRLLPLLVALAVSSHSFAFTYVPMTDAALIRSGESVVHGTVEGFRAGSPGNGSTVYTLNPASGVADSIEFRVPGAHPGFTHGFFAVGAPHFKVGEEVVLVLGPPDEDGIHGISQFALGAFRAVNSVHGKALVRDVSHGHAIGWSTVRDGPRLLDGFIEYAERIRADNRVVIPDQYFIPEEDLLRSESQRFTTMESGGNPLRWRFDQGVTADYKRNGGEAYEAALIDALSALQGAPNTNVDTAFSGTTNFSGDACEGFNNGVNAVLFGDPRDDIDGSFDCNSGGTLGIGGPCFGGTHEYEGKEFGTILAGRVVIQDGAECFLDGNNKKNAAQLLAHEFGHALGLGHSCGDNASGPCDDDPAGDNDALMRATAHNDDRGARLGVDDRNALFFLYGLSNVAVLFQDSFEP